MAHFFAMLPQPLPVHHSPSHSSRHTSTMAHNRPERSDSMFSSDSSSTSPTTSTNSATVSRSNSASSATVRTWSNGPGAVTIERVYAAPSDQDVILVPVRLKNEFRNSSTDGAEELPCRPAPRSFFRRLSTRIAPRFDNAAAKEERYEIIKMPRGEYRRFFKRDRYGNYAGSEKERQWNGQELKREYAAYQDAPLGSIV